MVILDTNVVSEFMRRHPEPAVVAWLNVRPPHDLFVTAVTEAEVRTASPSVLLEGVADTWFLLPTALSTSCSRNACCLSSVKLHARMRVSPRNDARRAARSPSSIVRLRRSPARWAQRWRPGTQGISMEPASPFWIPGSTAGDANAGRIRCPRHGLGAERRDGSDPDVDAAPVQQPGDPQPEHDLRQREGQRAVVVARPGLESVAEDPVVEG